MHPQISYFTGLLSFKGVGIFKKVTSVCGLCSGRSSVKCVLSPQKHGLVIIPDGTPNGDVDHEPQPSGITVVSQEAAQVLESAGEGPLGESGMFPLSHRIFSLFKIIHFD